MSKSKYDYVGLYISKYQKHCLYFGKCNCVIEVNLQPKPSCIEGLSENCNLFPGPE